MNSPVMYSAARCPYAQRARILLGEKGVDAEYREVDLDAPDADFLRASPFGRVPLLVHEGYRIWESSVICEYLDERFPRPALMPNNPGDRAWLRDWVDHANSEFAPCFYKLLSAQGESEQQAARDALTAAIRFVDEVALGDPRAGEYWLGDQITLADIAYFPFFERLPAVVTHRQFDWPAGCERSLAWFARMLQRPAVSCTQQTAEYHIANYARYASGDADPNLSLSTRDQ